MGQENQQPEMAKAEIDELVASFFGLFSNRSGTPDLERIFELFVAQGIIAKGSGPEPEISTLEAFLAPRKQLLADGSLTNFCEAETSESTLIFGRIAQRVCTYQKSGRLQGEPFSARGMKSFQFLHTPQGWRILAMAWDDERPGLELGQAQGSGTLDLNPGPL